MDTKTITLYQDDLNFIGEDGLEWTASEVECIVRAAFDQTDIGAQTNFRNFGTSEVVPGTSYSRAAYVETDSGYFFVSEDMMLHIIVTYSRWD